MAGARMTKTIRILVAVLVVIVVVPLLLLAAVAAAGVAHAAPANQECYSKTWYRWLGVNPFPNVATEVRIKARACVWTNTANGHYKGQVVNRETRSSQTFTPNGWADFYGLRFWQYDRYSPALDSHAFDAAVAYHDKWRQCQSVGGINLCPNSGSFVLGWEFHSPHLVRNSDGSVKRWNLLWHEGKPGQDATAGDRRIFIEVSD